MSDQLIPRAPKHKKQPTAEQLRHQLALAADEIIELRGRPPMMITCTHDTRAPWWRRLFRRKA